MLITKSKLQSNKGFTLIELLIVILILSLLTAIVLPIYTSKQEKARQTANASNISAIEAAADSYDIETGLAAADYKKIDATSVLVTKGFLKSLPTNPWASTSKAQGASGWGYILVKHKASPDVGKNTVNKVFLGNFASDTSITYYDSVADTATSTITCVNVIDGDSGLTGDANEQYYVADPNP